MAGYRFYSRADAAQDGIWRDTLDQWGEAQAVSYIRGLHQHLARLTSTRALWRRLPPNAAVPADIAEDVFMSRYERHYIFFKLLGNGDLGVVSILHDRMNLPARLAEDLSMLSARPEHDND